MSEEEPLSWTVIGSNLREAGEQLGELVSRIEAGEHPNEEELRIALAHAYHHLNVAWNARRVTTLRYRTMTDEDFEVWRKHPGDMDAPEE